MALNEILSCVNLTKWGLRTSLFSPTAAVSKQTQQHYKELFLFSISPKQSTYHGSENEKKHAIPWAAARSNLVGNPTSSWHVTVAKEGETRAYLPHFSCAIRSRSRLVQSNSALNTLFPSDSHLMVLINRGCVQWTFSLWICLSWCKIQFWPL